MPEPAAKPYQEVAVNEEELLVVDALLRVTPGGAAQWVLADFPPFATRRSDADIQLRLSPVTQKALSTRFELSLGWHPYCRVLGRYVSIGEPRPVFEPILLSLRPSGTLPENLAGKLLEEWEESNGPETKLWTHLVQLDEVVHEARLQRWMDIAGGRTVPKDEAGALAMAVEELRKADHFFASALKNFEEGWHDGPLAYLAGLVHFLGTDPEGPYAPLIQDIRETLGNSRLPRLLKDRWRPAVGGLAKTDLLRFGERQIEVLCATYKEPVRHEPTETAASPQQ